LGRRICKKPEWFIIVCDALEMNQARVEDQIREVFPVAEKGVELAEI
jgi:hypothetical protein